MQKTLLKILLPALFLFGSFGPAKAEALSLELADSLSYQYYLAADWDQLLVLGKQAQKEGIDFKYLQQRLGYACFMQKQYYKSIRHYQQALKFDPQDKLTQLYLYYNGLNTGMRSFARYYAGKLAKTDFEQYTEDSGFRPLDAIDVEYSYKLAAHNQRDNANYQRFGINTFLTYQLSLYQSVSRFRQRSDQVNLSKQNEYYALLGWTPLQRLSLGLAYHYVDTKVLLGEDVYPYPGHVFLGKMDFRHQRLLFSLSASDFRNDYVRSSQLAAHLGLGFAGANNIYLKSSLFRVFENRVYEGSSGWRYIFKQTAGIMLFDKIWTEASVNVGNLDNFVDLDGLYIYNSLDRSTFRSGLSTYWYINKHWTFYLNYTYDTKNIVLYNEFYTQQSITGGLLWKL